MLCLPDLQHQHPPHSCVDELPGQYQVIAVPVPLKRYKSCSQSLFGKKNSSELVFSVIIKESNMEQEDKIFILKDAPFRTQNQTAIFNKIFVNTPLETFFRMGWDI